MERPRRKRQARDGFAKELLRRRVRRAAPLHLARGEERVGPALAFELPLAGRLRARAYRSRAFTGRRIGKVARAKRRHLHMQVDAVEPRPGDPAAVARDAIRRAGAAPRVVTQIATRTSIRPARRDRSSYVRPRTDGA